MDTSKNIESAVTNPGQPWRAPAPPGEDLEMLERARRVLAGSRYPQLRQLQVYCNHGTLVLQGRLPTRDLKQLAQELLAPVSTRIDNDIRVKGLTHSDPNVGTSE